MFSVKKCYFDNCVYELEAMVVRIRVADYRPSRRNNHSGGRKRAFNLRQCITSIVLKAQYVTLEYISLPSLPDVILKMDINCASFTR